MSKLGPANLGNTTSSGITSPWISYAKESLINSTMLHVSLVLKESGRGSYNFTSTALWSLKTSVEMLIPTTWVLFKKFNLKSLK